MINILIVAQFLEQNFFIKNPPLKEFVITLRILKPFYL